MVRKRPPETVAFLFASDRLFVHVPARCQIAYTASGSCLRSALPDLGKHLAGDPLPGPGCAAIEGRGHSFSPRGGPAAQPNLLSQNTMASPRPCVGRHFGV